MYGLDKSKPVISIGIDCYHDQFRFNEMSLVLIRKNEFM